MSGKRSIFEEVGDGAVRAPEPKGGMIDQGKRGARGAIRLLADSCCLRWFW